MRVRAAGSTPDIPSPMLTVERREALLPAYTAATIVIGLGALLLVTVLGELPAAIAIPGIDEPWSPVAGVALWTLFGLTGSAAPRPWLVRAWRGYLPPPVHRRGDDPGRSDRRWLGRADRVVRPP